MRKVRAVVARNEGGSKLTGTKDTACIVPCRLWGGFTLCCRGLSDRFEARKRNKLNGGAQKAKAYVPTSSVK